MKSAYIFYIDDDVDDIGIFNECAESLGHRSISYSEPNEFINRLKNPPPAADIVMVDLNMPSTSGYDVIREIRNTPSLSKLPVIVHSTASDTHSIQMSREVGATMYIRKPASYSGMKKTIMHVTSINWRTFKTRDDNFYYSPDLPRPKNPAFYV